MKTIILCLNNLNLNCFNLIENILNLFSDRIIYAVPHITRKSKINEINGVNYYFISEEVYFTLSFLFFALISLFIGF